MTKQINRDDPRFQRSREALLEAVFALVEQARPETMSVKALCDAAGVTRPTFYQHFQSVEGAARAAALARLATQIPADPHDPAEPPTAQSIAARALPILVHLNEDRVFYRNVAEGAGSVEFFDALVALVERRVLAGGMLATEPDRVALVAGGVTWLVIRWLLSEDTDEKSMAARIGATIGSLV